MAIITSGFSRLPAPDAHWAALSHARDFRCLSGKRLVILSPLASHADDLSQFNYGLPGLAKTAAREWPDMSVQSISLAHSASNIGQVLSLAAPEVRIDHSGTTATPVLAASIQHIERTRRQTGKTWLVTGGARGVTAACIADLAARTGDRFALLGRSKITDWPQGVDPTSDLKTLRGALIGQARNAGQKPSLAEIDKSARRMLASAEIRHSLQAIKQAGGSAHYYSCDLTDGAQVASTLQDVRTSLGEITGFIHAAGVLADKLIMDKSRDEFDRVFSTKAIGLHTVLKQLDVQALTHIALFSSAAARFGNIGQSDYAMANEALNQAVYGLRAALPHANIKSFNWGPWDGGMVDEGLAARFKAQGIALIPLHAGAHIFSSQMLHGAHDHIELLIGDTWS